MRHNSLRYGIDLIIRSKLIPPRSGPRQLVRERLNQHLGQALDSPLTLVVAGAGYGKSTALADWLAETPWPVAWYGIAPGDDDPLLFLLHLIYAFEAVNPRITEQVLPAFSQNDDPGGVLRGQAVLVRLLNELTSQLATDTLLVLDDLHLVLGSPELSQMVDQLIAFLPPQLHVVLSSRQRPDLPALVRLQARGQVAYLFHQQLAFEYDEVVNLFRAQYNLPFSDAQIRQIWDKTEGWAIALQLIAQRAEADPDTMPDLDASLESLFTFLARDVLSRQPQPIQDFLTRTAILQQLTPATCDYLLDIDNSAAILAELAARDFFVIRVGEGMYRYHHLFADFLRTQLPDEAALHRRIAGYFRKKGLMELAVHHFLWGAAEAEAIELLIPLAPELVRAGRFGLLLQWLSNLPEALLARAPHLLLAYGDLYRYTSQYALALQRYEQAAEVFRLANDPLGQAEALQGQARVYLDTVRPAKASEPLRQAQALAAGSEPRFAVKQAEILAMLAENEANLGHADRAQALQAESTALLGRQATPIEVETRLLLRSGQLDRAREKLTRQAEYEKRAQRSAWAPRHHRETLLLLSLIYAMQGLPELARTYAGDGITIGRQLGAPFVEAVGYMRLGHAWQIGVDADPAQAEACYQQSIELSNKFEVARARVEPLWGLLRLYGFRGDLATAERYGYEALQLAERAGDGWIAAWVKLTLAASDLVAGKLEAGLASMREAYGDFVAGGDLFGQAAAMLWSALYAPADDTWALANLLQLAQKEGYDFLFGRPAFTLPVDPQATVPLLLRAREKGIETAYVKRLLAGLNLSNVRAHPGFTLRVQTLGPFRVWCGVNRVSPQAWRREKARHLF